MHDKGHAFLYIISYQLVIKLLINGFSSKEGKKNCIESIEKQCFTALWLKLCVNHVLLIVVRKLYVESLTGYCIFSIPYLTVEPGMLKNYATRVTSAWKTDANGSWPSLRMWRVGSEDMLMKSKICIRMELSGNAKHI